MGTGKWNRYRNYRGYWKWNANSKWKRFRKVELVQELELGTGTVGGY